MMISETPAIRERLGALPRWLVLGLMVIAMITTILRPLGLPITTWRGTRDYYETVQAIPPGGVLLFDIGYGAGGYPSLGPGTAAVFKQAFTRPIRLVIMATRIEGTMMYPLVMKDAEPVAKEHGKAYGTDYVFLGYVPGGQRAMAGVLGDPHGTVLMDHYGTPLANIPVMTDVRSPDDYDVVAFSTTSSETSGGWVRQAHDRYGKKVCAGLVYVPAHSMARAWYPASWAGVLDGIRGAAEYEYISGFPGDAIKNTDFLSVTQILVLAYITMGNIACWGHKLTRKRWER